MLKISITKLAHIKVS